jgi:hypothetical protein
VPDDRLEGVEVVLSGLRRHGDGDGVPITEGDLMGDLGSHRIDLARA